jgi:hypothetical protein
MSRKCVRRPGKKKIKRRTSDRIYSEGFSVELNPNFSGWNYTLA